MKNIVLKTIISTTLIFFSTGCGDNNKAEHNAHKSKIVTKSISKQDRQKTLKKHINSYKQYGFDIKQISSNNYIFSIKEPSKSLEVLLSMFHLNSSFQYKERQELQNILKGTQFDIKIDWDKYANNTQDSIEVNLIGKQDINSTNPINQLLKDKKVGAYLSYNNKDELKKITFKDINEVLNQHGQKTHIILSNAFVDIKQTPNDKSMHKKYDLIIKKLHTVFVDEVNTTVSMESKDILCKVDTINTYLGTQICKFPLINISLDIPNHKRTDIVLNNTRFNYDSTAKNKKVKGDLSFNIDSITSKNNVTIKDIKISAITENIDEDILKQYMQLLDNPSTNYQEHTAKIFELVAKLYNDTKMHYNTSIKSIDADLDTIKITLQDYQGQGNGSIDNELNYLEHSTIKKLMISDSKNKANAFVLNNFRFGYGIQHLFNILPKTMKILNALSTEENTTKLTNTLQQDGTALAKQTLNYGIDFNITSLGFNSINFHNQKQAISYDIGKSDFNIDITLKKNKLNVEDVMRSPMILLNYLKSNGKLIIPIKALQQLAKKPQFSMLGMLMMMANIENNNAIFVLQFDNGQFLINNKPLM
jgi:hypothetical protein